MFYVNLCVDIWYDISFILFESTPAKMDPIKPHQAEPTKPHQATENQLKLVIPNLQYNQGIQTQTKNQPPIYSKAIIPSECVSTYTLKTYTTYLQTAQPASQKL